MDFADDNPALGFTARLWASRPRASGTWIASYRSIPRSRWTASVRSAQSGSEAHRSAASGEHRLHRSGGPLPRRHADHRIPAGNVRDGSSRIVRSFEPGVPVTVARHSVDYVVTGARSRTSRVCLHQGTCGAPGSHRSPRSSKRDPRRRHGPMSAIELRDVCPRDGLQDYPDLVPTAVKLELIRRLYNAGLRSIEVTSFVSAKRVPQLADAAELWERSRPNPSRAPHCRSSWPTIVGWNVHCGTRSASSRPRYRRPTAWHRRTLLATQTPCSPRSRQCDGRPAPQP